MDADTGLYVPLGRIPDGTTGYPSCFRRGERRWHFGVEDSIGKLLPEIRTDEANAVLQLGIILVGVGIMYGITFLKPMLS